MRAAGLLCTGVPCELDPAVALRVAAGASPWRVVVARVAALRSTPRLAPALRTAGLRSGVVVRAGETLPRSAARTPLRLGADEVLRLTLGDEVLRLMLGDEELRLMLDDELLRLGELNELPRLLLEGLDERLTDEDELWLPPPRVPPPPRWAKAGVKLNASPTITRVANLEVFILLFLSFLFVFAYC